MIKNSYHVNKVAETTCRLYKHRYLFVVVPISKRICIQVEYMKVFLRNQENRKILVALTVDTVNILKLDEYLVVKT